MYHNFQLDSHVIWFPFNVQSYFYVVLLFMFQVLFNKEDSCEKAEERARKWRNCRKCWFRMCDGRHSLMVGE